MPPLRSHFLQRSNLFALHHLTTIVQLASEIASFPPEPFPVTSLATSHLRGSELIFIASMAICVATCCYQLYTLRLYYAVAASLWFLTDRPKSLFITAYSVASIALWSKQSYHSSWLTLAFVALSWLSLPY